MDLFNFLQPPEDESFYMRMAAVNQMSQMMQNMMMSPLGNMSFMGMDLQPMLGPAVGVPALRPAVSAHPWVDLFSPGAGSTFQSMSVLGGSANVHSYCSSTLMSMSTGPDGRPMVYQATSSTRSGPGGVCETQKSVCDNVSGTKKMQIGRHIGNRGHVIEREQNYISGEREEREDFINIEEDSQQGFNAQHKLWEADEAETFTEEFEYRSQMNRPNSYSTSRPRAITSGQSSAPPPAAVLALPSTQPYLPVGRHTPTNGWNESTYGTNWYPSQSNPDVAAVRNRNRPRKVSVRSTGDLHPYSCEKMRKRDHSQDEVGGPTSCKTQKTYLPSYENVD